MSGGVSLGRGESRPAARPVTLTPAPSQGPPPASAQPSVRHAGTHDAIIEVDPAPGVADRAAMVIDVEALDQPVDASVDEASITYSLNLLRQAPLNTELSEEQSRHLSRLSLSTRSQTVGLWDCGTQTPDYGPASVGNARQSPTNPYTNPMSAGSGGSGRNNMPVSIPTARQSGEAASTQTGDVVREVPVAAPTARRQGSRPPPDTAAATVAAAAAPDTAAAGRAPRAGRSPSRQAEGGVHIPTAAVEVFDLAAEDSDQGAPAADGPGARRRGPSRSRRGQSIAMTERIADSREEAGLPRYSEAAEYHYARREAGAPAEEPAPRDPMPPLSEPSRRQAQGEVAKLWKWWMLFLPFPQRIRDWPRPRGGGLSWSTAKPHQVFAYLYGRTDMTGVDVIGALRADAERHTRNFGYDEVQNEGLTPGVKVDIKRFPENSAVGVPVAARLGCKTGFALYQIDERTWQWQLIENRDPAETTTQLVQNNVRPALYVSVIQPYTARQNTVGSLTRAEQQVIVLTDPSLPLLLLLSWRPCRAAAKADAAPKAAARRQASERPRGMASPSDFPAWCSCL